MLRRFIAGMVGVMFLVCVGVVLAEDSKGKVKSVDADKGTITVTVGDKDMTFKAKDAEVKAGKKKIDLKDLKEGDNVTVSADGDKATTITKGKGK